MDLVNYTGNKEIKESIIDKEEYGTFVEKEKKKKKKKSNRPDKFKEIDEAKIKEQAAESELHKCEALSPEEKQMYSIASVHPLKIICNNLPFKITKEELFEYFNTLISTSNPEFAHPPPITGVEFDKYKKFAILTMSARKIKDFFRSHPEVSYIEGTTTFKMMKPKQFFDEKFLNKKEIKQAGEDNKIYLGGLPLAFMDEQVRKICETFGQLKFFNLVKEGSISKGYCFFEYEEHKNAEKAIKALNGFPIGDKKLKCHSATLANKGLSLSLTPNTSINTGLNETFSKPANHSMGSYLLSYQNIRNPEVQLTIVSDPLCKVASRVVQLLNMCSPEDLFDDEFVEDLEMDVQEACSKYGTIESMFIPRPNKKCGYTVPSVGKIFVKYMYITHAKRARAGISGRVYNKRTCVVSFYPEEKYNTKDYLIHV